MSWKTGPLPADTYGWGGVVPVDMVESGGFLFANFCGDTVEASLGSRILKPFEVAYYDNSLTLPPNMTGRGVKSDNPDDRPKG